LTKEEIEAIAALKDKIKHWFCSRKPFSLGSTCFNRSLYQPGV